MATQTNRNGRRQVIWMVVGLGLASLFLSGRAYAWSGSEHMRFPDQAYQVMNILRRGGAAFYATEAGQPSLTTCPASVCTPAACPSGCAAGNSCAACTQWNRFIAQATAAPPKLDRVSTDLSDFKLHAPDCDNLFPVLPAGALAQCRAGDLWFAPRRGWGGDNSDNDCFLRPGYMLGGADQHGPTELAVRPFFQDLPSNFTGAVLGEWATGPDDYNPDTRLWVRPTSVLLGSEITSLTKDAIETGLTIIVAPVFCLADLIFGGGDCVDDAESFSHDVDPQTWVDEGAGFLEMETIGQATIDSGDWPLKGNVSLPAMFHFAAVRNSGQFNHVPGYRATGASIAAFGGPPGWSPLDTAITALGDLTGLTVQPDKSEGVQHYSPYADGPDTRLLDDWIAAPVGHAEFEPVDNLARWGWDSFVNGTFGAKGLGWVLHAIGDADQPHHTAGTCGFGHQPWERFALLNWQGKFQESSLPLDYPHLQAIMAYAYHWWKYLDDRQTALKTTKLPVGDMVEAIAVETSGLPVSSFGHAFQQVNFFDTPSPADSDILSTYGGEANNMLDLMERTIGASMGFLAKASDFVPTKSDPCACATGSSRMGQTAAGDLIPAPGGICLQCGTGKFQTLPDYVDGVCLAACPPDKPTLQGGVCTATNVCPAATPFSQNGSCVAVCAAGSVVVNNRNCQRGACPTGTLKNGANFCIPQAPPKSPAICGPVNGDQTSSCCGPDHGLCGVNSDCCSHGCRGDGICLAQVGKTCNSNNDCLSGICVNGLCNPGHPGSICAQSGDCLSGQCTADHICAPGSPGSSCNAPSDCVSGTCGSSGVCLGTTGETCGSQNSLCIYGLCLNGACAGGPGDSCQSQPCGVGEQCGVLTGVCCGGDGAVCKTTAECCNQPCSNNFNPNIAGTCGVIIPG